MKYWHWRFISPTIFPAIIIVYRRKETHDCAKHWLLLIIGTFLISIHFAIHPLCTSVSTYLSHFCPSTFVLHLHFPDIVSQCGWFSKLPARSQSQDLKRERGGKKKKLKHFEILLKSQSAKSLHLIAIISIRHPETLKVAPNHHLSLKW